MSFNTYLEKIIEEVLKIIKITQKKSDHEKRELVIISDLAEYNFNWSIKDVFSNFEYPIENRSVDLINNNRQSSIK